MNALHIWTNKYLPPIIAALIWSALVIPRLLILILMAILIPQFIYQGAAIQKIIKFLTIEPTDGGY